MSKKKQTFWERAEEHDLKRIGKWLEQGLTPAQIKAKQDREERLFWIFAPLVTAGVLAFLVHTCTYDPTTDPEWQEEYQEVLRKDARKCQELFAYWNEGLITERQTRQLQKCIERWSEP